MEDWIGGVILLDRKEINTDEIIPAKYLDVVSKEGLGNHLFEDLKGINFMKAVEEAFNEGSIISSEMPSVLVAKDNFGCGSSREHAVWAIQDAGFKTVVAPSFARIFRGNAFNCGLLCVELAEEAIDQIFRMKAGFSRIHFDSSHEGPWIGFAEVRYGNVNTDNREKWPFSLNDFERELIERGGLVGYVNEHY